MTDKPTIDEQIQRIREAEMPEPVAWYDDGLEIHYGKTRPEYYGEGGWKPLYGPELLAYAQRKDAENEGLRNLLGEAQVFLKRAFIHSAKGCAACELIDRIGAKIDNAMKGGVE